MAIALLTTLYGVVLANMIAGPIAARLTLLSEMEIGWQRELVNRMLGLARAEMDLDSAASKPKARQPDVDASRQNAVKEAAGASFGSPGGCKCSHAHARLVAAFQWEG